MRAARFIPFWRDCAVFAVAEEGSRGQGTMGRLGRCVLSSGSKLAPCQAGAWGMSAGSGCRHAAYSPLTRARARRQALGPGCARWPGGAATLFDLWVLHVEAEEGAQSGPGRAQRNGGVRGRGGGIRGRAGGGGAARRRGSATRTGQGMGRVARDGLSLCQNQVGGASSDKRTVWAT